VIKIKIVAVVGAGLMAVTLAAAPALADPTGPTPPPYRELVGVGSETTQDVMNGMSNAILNGAGTKIIGSYDAVPNPGTITTKDPATHPQCQNIPRPSGSTNGVTALVNDRAAGNNCFQFARSSANSAASFPGAGLTYIPFAVDALTYMVRSDGSISRRLTAAQLTTIYNCAGPAAPTVPDATRVRPVLPQFGSGTRRSFLQSLGFTDAANFVTQPSHTCIRDIDAGGEPIIENVGTELTDRREIAPHSTAPYVAQLNTVVSDVRGLALLGHVNGVSSVSLNVNSPFRRDVYNVVPTSLLGTAPYNTTFVGTGSALCLNNTVINQFGFVPTANCGDTTITTP